MRVEELRLHKIYKFTDPSGYNNEFQAVFVTRWNGDASSLAFQDGEVARVAWKNIPEVRERLQEPKGNWTFCGYELDLLGFLAR